MGIYVSTGMSNIGLHDIKYEMTGWDLKTRPAVSIVVLM